MNGTGVSVILPANNEELAIGAEVEAVRRALTGADLLHEIIVVDDGSRDRTVAEAIETGARVLRHPENLGYGAAIKTGIGAARYETIVIIDADGTYPAERIPRLVARLETADMVVGARTGDRVEIPWLRRPAKWVLGWLASRIAGRRIPDLNSGLRAFRRQCVKQYFPILSNRFSFTTTVTLAYLADEYRVVYEPIDYRRRLGRSKISPRHFMDFMILVLRMAMLFQPLRVFVPLAGGCAAAGGVKAVFDVFALFRRVPVWDGSILYQPVLSTSAILLFLVAFQLLMIGMVADGVLRRIGQHNRPLAPSYATWGVEVRSEGRTEAPDVVADIRK
jgi:glycosyltransferase involved in cell wall biosynthesis